jgi:hypothetical protein
MGVTALVTSADDYQVVSKAGGIPESPITFGETVIATGEIPGLHLTD